jgi:hypothetical protein
VFNLLAIRVELQLAGQLAAQELMFDDKSRTRR